MPSKYDVLLNRLREKDDGGSGGGGLFAWQSTAILNNDTNIDFTLVADKPNIFIFENVRANGDFYNRLSIDNGVSFVTTGGYEWHNSIESSGAVAPINSNSTSSNVMLMAGPLNIVGQSNGSIEVSPKAGVLQQVVADIRYAYTSGGKYAGKLSHVAHHQLSTAILTNIRFTSALAASGMVSGKIHHYVKDLG